jgi:hypothetical protein
VTTRSPIHEALDRFGRDLGLEKKSGAWYRLCEEVIAVVDLQKSQYGASYYVNLGFWLRALGEERYPKGARCHIAVRLENLAPDERQGITRLLDLDHEMPDEQRIDELIALFKERLLPVIEQGSTLAGLRVMIDDGTLSSAAIRGPAQELLAAVKH